MSLFSVRTALFSAPLLIALGSPDRSAAQEPNRGEMPAAVPTPDDPKDTQSEMRDMATSMKSMADMCRTMMQREMQSRPYLIAAGAGLGAIVVVALILFVVLEVQWIRLLGVRIKTERRRLFEPSD